ncbi:MAG: hypothetical protein ACHQIH_02330 [Ignavibacteria bacterium]
MKKIRDMTIGELAAFVSTQLSMNGIDCTLTGGACISIYTNNKYESFDLDFIESGQFPQKKTEDILNGIGFYKENRYFKNKQTKYFIEFPSGPLSIGSEPVERYKEMEFETGKLKLLTPTDSVKDRLAAYYHWDDKQSLEQAILVCLDQKINMKEIEKFSADEGMIEKFNVIKRRLLNRK